jgi:hypothetical protein
MNPPTLAQMRSGVRAISPETVALLCDLLQVSGEEAREWAALSVIENPKNSHIAGALRRAFFVCWVVGVACPVNQTDAKPSSAKTDANSTLYTSSRIWRAIRLCMGLHPIPRGLAPDLWSAPRLIPAMQ